VLAPSRGISTMIGRGPEWPDGLALTSPGVPFEAATGCSATFTWGMFSVSTAPTLVASQFGGAVGVLEIGDLWVRVEQLSASDVTGRVGLRWQIALDGFWDSVTCASTLDASGSTLVG
jgi:hypothetical protein